MCIAGSEFIAFHFVLLTMLGATAHDSMFSASLRVTAGKNATLTRRPAPTETKPQVGKGRLNLSRQVWSQQDSPLFF